MLLSLGHVLMCCFAVGLSRSVVIGTNVFGNFFVRFGRQLQMLSRLVVVLLRLECRHSGRSGFLSFECHVSSFQNG